MERSRRSFMALAGLVPVAVLTARAAAPACYDPAGLPLSQRNRRRAIGFVEQAPDPAKRCQLCAFFHAGSGDCGKCDMLSGGPVTTRGHCSSFAARAA